MKHTLTLIASLVLLSGCGEMADGLSEGFDEGMAEEFAIACKDESAKLELPADLSNAACDCAAARSVEELSFTELASGESPKIDAIMEECFNEVTSSSEINTGTGAAIEQPSGEN